MELDLTGWIVTAIAILLTGISKSGLGGALGGLAVPFMSMWLSPRDAVAVMLPVLIAMDLFGIRAWRGKADWAELRLLLPAALVGIAVGSLSFGMMSDRMVKGAVGFIAVAFALDRLLRQGKALAPTGPLRNFAWLCGAGAGFTSTLAHAGGPPVMIYLLTRRLPREAFAGTSVFFFAAINLAKLPFYVGLDLFSRDTLAMSAMLLPLVPVGVWLGMRLLKWIPERPFYLLATAALGLSGVKLLWDGVVG
ncbi:MAG TPA: sulfite exporter TauE/SafE family protein [Zoogloea sp.]|uniref:sulfite exporter TauE/SafE family protein n=1 Tax=Zoogloea sp. TaxID=49181 RepID=UPI002C6844FD|nr:sulfite exporter TauE/SafE family protein [Zoogloea sp.]HOB45207.1 sulfite exporter TauE/SafE family protein [Zoogloea sp.]HQA08836.1 sulfite exporter TauE/SafE family protein [Zoogloea sp.]HQE39720.1 sulfite exporter TauE/SafE family protein [Zoogloea sp.]